MMHRFFSLGIGAGILWVLLVSSCAPVNLYTITMEYLSPESSVPPIGKIRGPITVAAFIDARHIDDTMRLGTVIPAEGKTIPVLPKYRRATETVTDGIKTCLSSQGYTLSPNNPSWDLRRDTIDQEWGHLLIGGSIDRLDVVCRYDGIKKIYQTDITLTLVFADIRNAQILLKMETTATASLTHVRFSEEMLGKQISTTLSDAIRRVCGDGRTLPQILDRIEN